MIVGGKQGAKEVEVPKGAIEMPFESNYLEKDDFDEKELNIHFHTLRVPFNDYLGSLTANPGHLRLIGRESLTNEHEQALVTLRWQAFEFDAEIALMYQPTTYQQMAGLVNYYNTQLWSMIQVTWNEIIGQRFRQYWMLQFYLMIM